MCVIKSGPHEGSEPGCFYHLFSPSDKQGLGKVSGSSQASHQGRGGSSQSPRSLLLRARSFQPQAQGLGDTPCCPGHLPSPHSIMMTVWLKVVTCLTKQRKRADSGVRAHGQNAGLSSNHFRVRAPRAADLLQLAPGSPLGTRLQL